MFLIVFTVADVFFVSPNRIRIRHETLSSDKIPLSMNNVQIAFFSDVDFGKNFTQSNLDTLVAKINNSSPDVVLFGGNLFDGATSLQDDEKQSIIDALAGIQAPLGKFAVYGELDHSNDDTLSLVADILQKSDFEILENSSLSLRNKSSEGISLVGLENGVNGTLDVDTAYSSVPRDNYVITLCNTPDTADRVPGDLTDYFLAGHSHGGQIYYLFSSYYHPEGASSHLRGKEKIDNAFTLDITYGVGTIGKKARLFAPSEIVLYTLKSTQTPQDTELDTSTSPSDSTSSPESTSTPNSSTQPDSTQTPQSTSQPEATSTPSEESQESTSNE